MIPKHVRAKVFQTVNAGQVVVQAQTCNAGHGVIGSRREAEGRGLPDLDFQERKSISDSSKRLQCGSAYGLGLLTR